MNYKCCSCYSIYCNLFKSNTIPFLLCFNTLRLSSSNAKLWNAGGRMLVDFPPKKSCLSSCENIRYRAQSKSNIVNFYSLSSSCSCLETGYGLIFPIAESACRVDLFRSKKHIRCRTFYAVSLWGHSIRTSAKNQPFWTPSPPLYAFSSSKDRPPPI